jgi:hypothetical protein
MPSQEIVQIWASGFIKLLEEALKDLLKKYEKKLASSELKFLG